MNVGGFLERMPEVLCTDFRDDVFSSLRVLTHGMTSPRIAKLLNFGVKQLDSDKECYVEIGTFTGYSLLSAGYETAARIIGIDNFSLLFKTNGDEFPVKKILDDNLKLFRSQEITLIEADFRNVKNEHFPEPGKTIGLLFVDGNHTYRDAIDSLKWAFPMLSAEVAVILDDINVPGVSRAVSEWLLNNPEFKLSFYCNTGNRTKFSDPYMHNGLLVATRSLFDAATANN